MAELVLSSAGKALGAKLPGAFASVGAVLGQASGAALGRAIDTRLFGANLQRDGARLTDLHLQGSTEGASIPAVYGQVRLAGQVIWAARFKEHVDEQSTRSGKGGGGRVTTRRFRYTLSFAVGLCEGEIARIGRVWANGELLDLSQITWRLHNGASDQTPDALIEAIEGADFAPAYRDLAYVVFEDLPLDSFGNAIPQLSFEVVRPAPADEEQRFETRVKGVCLIPGAGEFVYATEPVARLLGPGAEIAENVHAERNRANLRVSLDQLAADLPNCERVLLVVSWFGTDLRCGQCQIMPGVEDATKVTEPQTWAAGGVTRAGARLVSQYEGGPAFGGTPSDSSVLQAIAELKARGYKVGLYPFILMDVPHGNALPDPYGAAAQAPYPWRGRITVHPAAGQAGSPDKSVAAAAQINAFFGAAAPAHFGASSGVPTYSGPAEWSFRRFVLHYAKLAQLAGGVDAFIIGSELRGVTSARSSASHYPAVSALRALATDVRALLGAGATLTYAADWSEYSGHQPQDGSGDVFFHLDPLWADENIDVVGVDWYAPLTDWRAGVAHADAALARDIYDGAYLQDRIEGGETFDWHYASEIDRAAQARTPITDGAYGEPWIFRAKDIRNFWQRPHYNRPGGVRALEPTEWTPQSKPIWFAELGCPAIDKGANAPNLFFDPKSAESAAPPFSTGARDDLMQRRVLDAYHRNWGEDSAANPVSIVNGKRMIDAMHVWCWDARPYPAFPARAEVWADAPSWRFGHWLNGRAGLSPLGAVVADLCRRSGFEDFDVAGLRGAVSGYIADAPAPARSLIEPLMAAYDFDAAEREGRLVFFHRHAQGEAEWDASKATALQAPLFARRGDTAEQALEARVRFLDAARDYALGAVSARRLDRADGGVLTIEAPLVLDSAAAEAIAQRALTRARAAAESLSLETAPSALALEPGDVIAHGAGGAFEVVRIEEGAARALELERAPEYAAPAAAVAEPGSKAVAALAPKPIVSVLDLPPLPDAESDERPLVAVFASPWRGAHEVFAGEGLTRRALVEQPSVIGELLWPLWPGPVDRWDMGNAVRVKMYNGALASVSREAVLRGENVFAIEAGDGDWEIVQPQSCVLAAASEYVLSGFLRGQLGTAHAMRAPHPAGARIVKLDRSLARLSILAHEWGEALALSAPPCGEASNHARAAAALITLSHAAVRPWAPAHLRARRFTNGDLLLTWVRRASTGGDAWTGEPPLGAGTDLYRIEVHAGGVLKRTVDVAAAGYMYPVAQQSADAVGAAGSFRVRVGQYAVSGAIGLNSELTITL